MYGGQLAENVVNFYEIQFFFNLIKKNAASSNEERKL